MNPALVSHPICRRHETGPGHPERPGRFRAVDRALTEAFPDLPRFEAPDVTREQLLRVHSEPHVAVVEELAPERGLVRFDEDSFMGPHSLRAARRAAGVAVLAVDLVMAGDARAAFCNVRPPGHHAERDIVKGFCLFNNVAVGALHALEAHGLERIAIIDFDVHHGNGTEDVALQDERVMLCSSFQHPFYPYSGADTHQPHIRNVPLPAGTDGPAWRAAVARAWFDALDAFAPQFVFFSAGFDSHKRDPLGNFGLLEDDFAWITREVAGIAASHAGGRVVSVLEGGYDLVALAGSAIAHVDALGG